MLKEKFIRSLIKEKLVLLMEDQPKGSDDIEIVKDLYSQSELQKMIKDHLGPEYNDIPWSSDVFNDTWIKDNPKHAKVPTRLQRVSPVALRTNRSVRCYRFLTL